MRRRARECAVQFLYQLELAKEIASPSDALPDKWRLFWESFEEVDDDTRQFAERLGGGVISQLGIVDAKLREVSEHWRPERMARVDLSLLRLAAYEIMCCADIPRAVSINEALEIAKRFGGEESARFINGVLDQFSDIEDNGEDRLVDEHDERAAADPGG